MLSTLTRFSLSSLRFGYTKVITMASTCTINNLEEQAKQAEEIMSDLKARVLALRSSAVKKAIVQQEELLAKENASLLSEVNSLKQTLVRAEIKNGVKQVSLPKRTSSSAADLQGGEKQTAMVKDPSKDATSGAKNEKKTDKKAEKKTNKPNEGNTAKKRPAPAEDLPVDISRLDLRIGCIVSAKNHPDADSLYVEEVDLGEGTNRTILSGLVKHVPMETMQNKLAIFMCNLKPAKMRGILSQGMIMCASTPEKVEIIDPPAGVKPGDRVTFEGYPGAPDAQLNPKKKVWEQIQPDLRVDGTGVAVYKGVPFKVEGLGICKAPTMKDCPIK